MKPWRVIGLFTFCWMASASSVADLLDTEQGRHGANRAMTWGFDPAAAPHIRIGADSVSWLERFQDRDGRACLRYRVSRGDDGGDGVVCRAWGEGGLQLVRVEDPPAMSEEEPSRVAPGEANRKASVREPVVPDTPQAAFERRVLWSSSLLLLPLGWIVWRGWLRKQP